MKKSYYLSMTFNNIVFKGRNQEYGAYVLRKTYSKHMTLAAILATALFSGALVGPLVESILNAGQEKYIKPTFDISDPFIVELPILPKPPVEPKQEVAPAAAQPEKQVKTIKDVKVRVVEDNAKEETSTPPDQDLLKNVNIGTNTLDGELPDMPGTTVDTKDDAAIGTGMGAGTAPAGEPTEFQYVEDMPAFVGGEGAMFSFLGKKMRYPAAAQRAGVEGIVVVTFVVAPDGAITRAEIVKGLGYGTDEEALRVVNSMPNWKPGRQNGRAVPVRFTLPIRFSLR